MSPVEIEAAISELADQAFDAAEFPFAFLAASGNKDTALKRLRSGHNKTPDVRCIIRLARTDVRNDDVLERIDIGRRFKNDTERLQKPFDLYTPLTAGPGKPGKPRRAPAQALDS